MFRRAEVLIAALVFLSLAGIYIFANNKSPMKQDTFERATFAGGCFWCMQQAMDQVEGVVHSKVGYTGGRVDNPTYEEVSSGSTGHAEAVTVQFNPVVLTYRELLDVFWRNIDPEAKANEGQFCDIGTQYRSAIYFHNPEQERQARQSKQELIDSKTFEEVYTEITPAAAFYEAEQYHQNYYKKNPIRYKIYKFLCGREKRLEELWGKGG